jgi:hypothetical protein
MRYLCEFSSRPWRVALSVFVFLLVLAVACGSAAEPQSAADPAPQEPVATGSTGAVPTAAPTPASPLAVASTEVHPGKLTIMVGGWVASGLTSFSGVRQGEGITMTELCTDIWSPKTREEGWPQV